MSELFWRHILLLWGVSAKVWPLTSFLASSSCSHITSPLVTALVITMLTFLLKNLQIIRSIWRMRFLGELCFQCGCEVWT